MRDSEEEDSFFGMETLNAPFCSLNDEYYNGSPRNFWNTFSADCDPDLDPHSNDSKEFFYQSQSGESCEQPVEKLKVHFKEGFIVG